jgi:hypothetical protein
LSEAKLAGRSLQNADGTVASSLYLDSLSDQILVPNKIFEDLSSEIQ